MSSVKAGILRAGEIITSCPSEDNASGGAGGADGGLTLVPVEGGGTSGKLDWSSVLLA